MTTAHFTKPKSLLVGLASAAIVVGTTVAVSTPIFAQNTNQVSDTDNLVALTAIPPRMGEDNSLLLQPGEKKQVTLRVNNSSSQDIVVQSTALDFIVQEDGQTPIPIDVEDTNNRWSLASWLTITPNQLTVPANESVGLSVLIEVPEDALPGGHYAMVTHQPMLGSSEEDIAAGTVQNTGVNQKVGTLLYVIVDGPINEKAFIQNLQVPDFSEFGPVPFSFTVDNESDVHIRPQVSVNIYNMFNQKVATIQPETRNIFPFTSRDFAGEWERIWGFGRYTAEVSMMYGTTNQLAIAKTNFWLIPIKLIIAILVVLLLLILGGMSVRRHMIHRKEDQSAKISELEGKLKKLEDEKLKKFEE